MSRGYGKLQRSIIDMLSGTPDAVSAKAIATSLSGGPPSDSMVRSVHRALHRLHDSHPNVCMVGWDAVRHPGFAPFFGVRWLWLPSELKDEVVAEAAVELAEYRRLMASGSKWPEAKRAVWEMHVAKADRRRHRVHTGQ